MAFIAGQEDNIQNSAKTLLAKKAGKKLPAGFYDGVRGWLKTEWECLRKSKSGEKSSPKILW